MVFSALNSLSALTKDRKMDRKKADNSIVLSTAL